MANGPSSFGTEPFDEAPTSDGGSGSSPPSNSRPEAGANMPGGVPEQPDADAGLSAAETDANGCFSTDPVGGVTKQCPPNNPPYEPARWKAVERSTNCYAYAANDPAGHPPGKPQPGEHCGHRYTDTTCSNVGAAAKCDGMIPAPDPPTPKAGFYVVALVVDEGVDYHWYRQDDNGLWSNKHGNGPVENVDGKGNLITDPKTADHNYFGLYHYKWCGYYYVPAGGIRTGPP